jgi:hypothetical protein
VAWTILRLPQRPKEIQTLERSVDIETSKHGMVIEELEII